ncbi:hypothetical protein BX666DRAFT_2022560 [Dichotomocladium elegans]|nr:hypothetical protein BX666DRAFT_2022560 [Dichotomocladium elegans]
MTVTGYLCFLSLGIRPDPKDDEHGFDVQTLRRINRAIDEAQISVVKSISRHGAPVEQQAYKKNLAIDVLTVGTVVANYILCFPAVAYRHRLQAFPVYRGWEQDTPVSFMRRFWSEYQQSGLRRMYPGFGLGLLSQAMITTWETLIRNMSKYVLIKAESDLAYVTLRLTDLCLGILSHFLIYPFNRNALIIRVQADCTHQPIRTVRDFGELYKRELLRIFSPSSGGLPVLSVIVPTIFMYLATETIMMSVYKAAYKFINPPNEKIRRRRERRVRRQHHNNASPSRHNRDNGVVDAPVATDNFATSAARDTLPRAYYCEIVCGVVASLVTRFITYPMDSVLFKLILQDSGIQTNQTSYTGFFNCISRTWRYEGGWKAFFPGWGGLVLEVAASYLVLEGSWIIYKAIDWKTQRVSDYEPRSVRKARHLWDRMGHST